MISERFVSLCLTSTFMPHINAQTFQGKFQANFKLNMTSRKEETCLIFSFSLESPIHSQNGPSHWCLPSCVGDSRECLMWLSVRLKGTHIPPPSLPAPLQAQLIRTACFLSCYLEITYPIYFKI